MSTAAELLGQLTACGSTSDNDAISLIARILQDHERRIAAVEVARNDGEPARPVGLDEAAGRVDEGQSPGMRVADPAKPSRASLGRLEMVHTLNDLRDHLDGRVAWLEAALANLESMVQGKMQDMVKHIGLVTQQSRAEGRAPASPPRTASPRGPVAGFDDGTAVRASPGSNRGGFRSQSMCVHVSILGVRLRPAFIGRSLGKFVRRETGLLSSYNLPQRGCFRV